MNREQGFALANNEFSSSYFELWIENYESQYNQAPALHI